MSLRWTSVVRQLRGQNIVSLHSRTRNNVVSSRGKAERPGVRVGPEQGVVVGGGVTVLVGNFRAVPCLAPRDQTAVQRRGAGVGGIYTTAAVLGFVLRDRAVVNRQGTVVVETNSKILI